MRRALAAGLRTGVADGGEGADDERQRLLSGEVPVDGTRAQRMREHPSTRQFDQADHPFTAGQDAWRELTARFPDIRVVAEDILVDGRLAEMWGATEGPRVSST